ncbi:condensation domain-containing protein [Kitasatospora sp. NPDC004240]
MTQTRRITVRYHGPGSGTGPLTLGQDNMIRCILRDLPEQINRDMVWPVPDGTGLTAALDALRALAERHESLRTVFPPGPDGFPGHQELRAEGEFTVEVISADHLDDAGLDGLAEELGRAGNTLGFDLAADFPLRLTLLTRGEHVVRLVVVVCHSGADGAACVLLLQDWLALAAGKELPPVTGRTPLQIAAAEATDLGRRKATASLRHWERILRTHPQAVFAEDRLTGPPDLMCAHVLRSPSGAADLAAASARTGASPSVVLLAAFAALVAHRADRSELVIAALSANRQRAALADHVGTLAQDAFLALDARPGDLDELIGRAKAATLAGYWHGTFDAARIWQMIEDIAHRRGSRYARQVVVNDLGLTIPESVSAARPVPAADPEIIRIPDQRVPVRIMLNILRINGSLEFALLTCPQLLDHAEGERFSHGLLTLLRAAAAGPVPLDGLTALTGLRPGTRDREWALVDGSWIDPAAVRELLAHALGPGAAVPVAGIRVEAADGRLTAHLTTDDDTLTPLLAHRAVVAALPGRDTAMAPTDYVVHHPAHTTHGPGRDPATPDWQALLS